MFQILPKGRAIGEFKRLCQSSNDQKCDDIWRLGCATIDP